MISWEVQAKTMVSANALRGKVVWSCDGRKRPVQGARAEREGEQVCGCGEGAVETAGRPMLKTAEIRSHDRAVKGRTQGHDGL